MADFPQRSDVRVAAGAALSAFLGVFFATPAQAQKEPPAFPSRTVTIVVPFSAGGGTDVVARAIAPKLNEIWGQPVVVDNRTGASGTIGMSIVAKAPPDGHMVGMMIITHATNAAVQGSKSPIDLVRDFSHVSQIVSQPYVLIVNASLPVKSIKELVALARTQPGAITYGSSGIGGVLHLAGELLGIRTKTKLTHVPYKGAAPAVADVAGGHIAMTFATLMSAQPLITRGRARALALTSTERIASAPDIPTVQESGLTGPFEVSGWYGISAAAGTPPAIVDRFSRDIARVVNLPDVRERMLAEGTFPTSSTPAQFAELVRSEVEKWRGIIKQAGITPEVR